MSNNTLPLQNQPLSMVTPDLRLLDAKFTLISFIIHTGVEITNEHEKHFLMYARRHFPLPPLHLFHDSKRVWRYTSTFLFQGSLFTWSLQRRTGTIGTQANGFVLCDRNMLGEQRSFPHCEKKQILRGKPTISILNYLRKKLVLLYQF